MLQFNFISQNTKLKQVYNNLRGFNKLAISDLNLMVSTFKEMGQSNKSKIRTFEM